MTERGLGQMQLFRGGGQRAVLFDGADDFKMGSFQDGHGGQTHEYDSLIHENLPFLFMH
jgi:hypothetical protein